MFFNEVQVPKVTHEQIDAARKIIPSLDIRPVVDREVAFQVALAKTEQTLERYEFISHRELQALPAGVSSPYKLENLEMIHYVEETESGWNFHIVVAGD